MGAVSAAIQHPQLEFWVAGGRGFPDGQGHKPILTAPDQQHGHPQLLEQGGGGGASGTVGHAQAHASQGPGCCGALGRTGDQLQQLRVGLD